MDSTGIIADIGIDYKTSKAKVTFLFDNKDVLKEAEKLQNIKLDIKAKKWRNKRSNDANAYLWVLVEKIGEKLDMSRKEVYRKHILEAGVYEELQMKEEAMKKFNEIWQEQGIAWFCRKVVNEYGEIVLQAYYGSSTYDTKEMTRLIDSVVQDCHELGIETKTPAELDSLLKSWKSGAK